MAPWSTSRWRGRRPSAARSCCAGATEELDGRGPSGPPCWSCGSTASSSWTRPRTPARSPWPASRSTAARPAHVLVGGLGLGFTTHEVLSDDRVERVVVAEIEEALVRWFRDGTVPHGPAYLADERLHVAVGDVGRWSRRRRPAASTWCCSTSTTVPTSWCTTTTPALRGAVPGRGPRPAAPRRRRRRLVVDRRRGARRTHHRGVRRLRHRGRTRWLQDRDEELLAARRPAPRPDRPHATAPDRPPDRGDPMSTPLDSTRPASSTTAWARSRCPSDALWRAQTQRAVENFPISGRRARGRPRPGARPGQGGRGAGQRRASASSTTTSPTAIAHGAARGRRRRARRRTSRSTSSRPGRAPAPT